MQRQSTLGNVTRSILQQPKANAKAPTAEQIRAQINQILEDEITTYPSDITRNALIEMAALMDSAYPKAVTYQNHVHNLNINKNTLIERIPGFDKLHRSAQQKHTSELLMLHKEAKSEVNAMVALLKQFAKNINNWHPKHFDDLMQKQEEMGI